MWAPLIQRNSLTPISTVLVARIGANKNLLSLALDSRHEGLENRKNEVWDQNWFFLLILKTKGT
jgi:hypothetical protein